MKILARVYCVTLQEFGAPAHDPINGTVNGTVGWQQVVFNAIYSAADDDLNRTFAQATPTMKIEMTINNPNVFGAFKPGHLYDLSFIPTPDPAAAGAA